MQCTVSKPEVSVIVPVWNDEAGLERCLQRLRSQTLPDWRYEIIVIDNGSTDRSAEVARGYDGVVVAHEPRPGSYVARNTGIRLAQGSVLAFTDADCVPELDWLEQGVDILARQPDTSVVAGRVLLFSETETPFQSPAAVYERVFAFDQRRNAARGHCVTANWFSPREAVVAAGGFDATRRSGGDYALASELRRRGGRVVYAEQACVRHPIRASFRDLCAKRRRVVGGNWSDAKTGSKLAHAIDGAVKDCARKIVRALSHRETAVLNRVVAACVAGVLCGVSVLEITRLATGGEPRR